MYPPHLTVASLKSSKIFPKNNLIAIQSIVPYLVPYPSSLSDDHDSIPTSFYAIPAILLLLFLPLFFLVARILFKSMAAAL